MELLSQVKISPTTWSLLAACVAAYAIVYPTVLVIYRLFFSPLAKFPGPKIAAATGWYEVYHDVFRNGKYVFEIEKMHEKYGPIVRINPSEISIHDPPFYDEVYVGAHVRKSNKFPPFSHGVGLEGSALLTIDHDHHRRRRKILDPHFSRSAVRRLEPLLAQLLERFDQRLREKKGSIVRFDHAFVAFSGDLIRCITCEEIDFLMDDPHWSKHWFELFDGLVRSCPLFMSFPWIIHVVTLVPERILAWLYPRGKVFIDFKKIARAHIEEAKLDKLADSEKGKKAFVGNSVFRAIVNSDAPESEMSTDRLVKEAQALLGAATVATGRVLGVILYHVAANPHIRERLAAELAEPMANFPSQFPAHSELEQMPYLQAVVNEGFRLGYGSMHRMPRCFPDTPIVYKDWIIPAGTPIGMSAYLNHTDARMFPDPLSFNPDRWLGADVHPRMKKYLTPFGRGSRSCIGQHLATTEITMMTAALFRPDAPGIEMFETDETDVTYIHDCMLPLPKSSSLGLRAVIR